MISLICHKQYKQAIIIITRNTFCRTRSLSCATLSFLITWGSSSSQSAASAVYKISSKSDDYSLRWRFSKWRPYGNCFTTIRDHPRSLCCWPQLPDKFHVNLIRYNTIVCIQRAVKSWRVASLVYHTDLNFSHIWLEMPGGFGGLWTPADALVNCEVPD